jgi:phage tail sheath protein FI
MDTTYAGVYTPWIDVEDTTSGYPIQIPPSGHVAAIFARTDRTTATWFSPAGLKRGYLNILGVGNIYNQEARDIFEPAQINCIRVIPGVGTALWGDRTLQLRDTALSFISVRRLMLYIASSTERVLLSSVFDPNDDALRTDIKHSLITLLDPIKDGKGLYDYTVRCDDKNNSKNDIAAGVLNVDVFLDPVIPARKINVRLVITRTGVDLKVL